MARAAPSADSASPPIVTSRPLIWAVIGRAPGASPATAAAAATARRPTSRSIASPRNRFPAPQSSASGTSPQSQRPGCDMPDPQAPFVPGPDASRRPCPERCRTTRREAHRALAAERRSRCPAERSVDLRKRLHPAPVNLSKGFGAPRTCIHEKSPGFPRGFRLGSCETIRSRAGCADGRRSCLRS